MAESWGKCLEVARRGYDEKAQRINAKEDRKWHSNRWQMQTGIMAGNRGRGVRGMPWAQIPQPGYRHPVPSFRVFTIITFLMVSITRKEATLVHW